MIGATYELNGIPLDDPQGRWALLAASGTPAAAGVQLALVDAPNIHGKAAVGSVRRGVGRIALTLLVDGFGDHARLREHLALLMNAASGWVGNGKVPIVYDDGMVRMKTYGILSSTVDLRLENDGDVYEVVLTFTLPDPFWEDEVSSRLYLRPGVARAWGGLSGGSAPVQPLVTVKGRNITGVTVRCVNTGESVSWAGRGNEIRWEGWNATGGGGSGFGADGVPVLCPDAFGDYRVQVDVTGEVESIVLTGRRRFQ